jgi:Spy/CpxP family protein refolding chaperone
MAVVLPAVVLPAGVVWAVVEAGSADIAEQAAAAPESSPPPCRRAGPSTEPLFGYDAPAVPVQGICGRKTEKIFTEERIMDRQKVFWQALVGLLFMAALLVLSPGPARGEGRGFSALERETLIKELNLTPEQTKAFQAIGDRCDLDREKIIAAVRNKEGDLEKALAVPKPDESKIKELVAGVIQGHDQLFQTLKTQRQEEMALLNSLQQGKFILALKKWHDRTKEAPGK